MFGKKKKDNSAEESQVEIEDFNSEEALNSSNVPQRPEVPVLPSLPAQPDMNKSELDEEIDNIVEDVTEESVLSETIVEADPELVQEEAYAETEEELEISEENIDEPEVEETTEESVASETLVELDSEKVEETEIETEEDAESEVESVKTFEQAQLPSLGKSFRGYNPDEADDFIYNIVDEYNLLLAAKNESEEKVNLLLEAREELLNRQQEDATLIDALKTFNLTDEVKKMLDGASIEAQKIIEEAQLEAENIKLNAEKEAEETLIKTAEERDAIVSQAEGIVDKAKAEAELEAKFILDKANDALAQAEKDIARNLTEVHDEANTIKENAKKEAESIIKETQNKSELIIKETNESLAEAKEFIAKRKEVTARFIDMYKKQAEFLANEHNNLP